MTHPAIRQRAKIVALANKLLPALPELLAEIRAQEQGQPGAQTYDTDQVHGSDVSDPTGQAAINPDQARAAEARVLVLCNMLLAQLDQLDGIYITYLHAPLDTDTAKAMTSDSDPPGCKSCSRLKQGKNKRPYRSEVWRRSDVNGNLSEPWDLCQWCYLFVKQTSQLPSRAQLKQHAQGRRVQRRVDPRTGDAA